MNEGEEAVNEKDSIGEAEHIEVQTCQCCQCQQKRRYRQYVVYEEDILANLDDWD